ncbi:hypothetical protein ACFL0Q_06150, partial [Thermodesulfobacteriota bacterium]
VSNRQIFTVGYAACWAHLHWDRMSPVGRAIRRNTMPGFPWDEVGIPKMPMPDTWEPITDEQATP